MQALSNAMAVDCHIYECCRRPRGPQEFAAFVDISFIAHLAAGFPARSGRPLGL
jgi:hypothetical protein